MTRIDAYRPDVYELCKIVTGSTEKARTAMRRAQRAQMPSASIKRIIDKIEDYDDALNYLTLNQKRVVTTLFGDSW